MDCANMAPMTKRALYGLLGGTAVGLLDLAVMLLLGVEVTWHGHNLILVVMGVFTATFAALGYANGKLMDARAELEQSHAEKLQFERLASMGRMAATVAHEVRNPLGVIKSSAALLTESLPHEDEDGRKAGRFIAEEIDRLDAFVRSMLDFSRPITAQRHSVTLATLTERVLRLCDDDKLVIDVGEGACSVDADLMVRAIAALTDNACQAANERVELSIHVEGERLNISVSDDGEGIDPDVGETIFEPFVTTRPSGTGLGLPIAARIVEAHDGIIELEPSPAGACFWISVPKAA